MTNILIHGLGQDATSWNETIEYLGKQDEFNCPNLSLLLKKKEVSYSNLYDSFSEYCNGFSKPLNLCGLSLGGVLALNYAIDNPTKVKSLVLVAAQYKMPKTLLKFQNIIFNFMPKSSFESMGMEKDDFINLTKTMMNIDFEEKVKDIECPVLVICGEKDAPNKKVSINLSKYIRKSHIQFIEDAKHEVNTQAPKQLADAINIFYNEVIM